MSRCIPVLLLSLALLGAAPISSTAAAASPLAASGAGGRSAVSVTNATHETGADLLPFSGIDAAFAVLVGGGLVLLGAGLRRLSARTAGK